MCLPTGVEPVKEFFAIALAEWPASPACHGRNRLTTFEERLVGQQITDDFHQTRSPAGVLLAGLRTTQLPAASGRPRASRRRSSSGKFRELIWRHASVWVHGNE